MTPTHVAAPTRFQEPFSFSSYEEFWPYYVSQHLSAACRFLHFVGTCAAFAVIAAAAVSQQWLLLLAAPVAGYGFAWVGHFVIEKNKPATFRFPLWSLRGDMRMYRYMVLFRMQAEIERLGLAGTRTA